ncbi:hypothetical protein AB0I60_21700 [Actinosynnema sp. NPDC050436]|uniref:hypothetical protein n=1 Tax=Actinosynnema sp. NPDC050436 TaxID=3155659 RepID=UPI003402A837
MISDRHHVSPGTAWIGVDVAFELGKTQGFVFEHVLEVVSTPGVVGSKSLVHSFELDRPDEGIRTARMVCPTCDQHFLLDIRSTEAAKRRRRNLLLGGLVVVLLIVGATQASFLSSFAKALIVALGGAFVALPLLLSSFSAKGHSGFRRLGPDGKVLPDLGGHRVQ